MVYDDIGGVETTGDSDTGYDDSEGSNLVLTILKRTMRDNSVHYRLNRFARVVGRDDTATTVINYSAEKQHETSLQTVERDFKVQCYNFAASSSSDAHEGAAKSLCTVARDALNILKRYETPRQDAREGALQRRGAVARDTSYEKQ